MKYTNKHYMYIAIGLLCSIGITSCAQLDPHKTLWETTQQVTKKAGIGNRANEYRDSKDESDLTMPTGVQLSDSKASYPVPSVSNRSTTLSDSDLPPGSLAARVYLTKQDPGTLQVTPLSQLKVTRNRDDTGSLQLNTGFQSAWDVTGLAIVTSPYQLVNANHEVGIYTIADPRQTNANKRKKILYQITVRGGTAQQSQLLIAGEKGQPLPANQTEQVLQTLRKQLLALNNKQTAQLKPVALVTTDIYANPDMLLNRSVRQGQSAIITALKKAGFTTLKSAAKSSAYLFVDTRNNKKISNDMPIYLLYYRDRGLYSTYYVLDSNTKLLPENIAQGMLTAISKAINR